MNAWLDCPACSARFDIGPMFHGCPACQAKGKTAPLEVAYALQARRPDSSGHAVPGLWRWRSLFPPTREESALSLQEGGTPLLRVRSGREGLTLLVKNETANPTWSWKDRPNCVSVSMSREFGFHRVAAISTGNHGCAAAAYSAAAGLNCVVFCHADAPLTQVALMSSYGATVIRGGDQEALLRQLLRRGDCYPSTILCRRAGYSNPFGIEGFKTIAFEICEQMSQSVPDRVFVPTGSGDGIYGVWKGFRELRALGWIDKTPKMIACQASGADSHSGHFKENRDTANHCPLRLLWRSRWRSASRAIMPCVRSMSLAAVS